MVVPEVHLAEGPWLYLGGLSVHRQRDEYRKRLFWKAAGEGKVAGLSGKAQKGQHPAGSGDLDSWNRRVTSSGMKQCCFPLERKHLTCLG